MSVWKIVFFEMNEGSYNIKNVLREQYDKCGFAELFSLGNKNTNQAMNVYIADKVLNRYVCFKSIIPSDTNEISLSKGDKQKIQYLDIEPKYYNKLDNICKACCITQKVFNAYDRYISCYLYPLYEPKDDLDIYSANSVHDAQAVILIMKAAIDIHDSLYKILKSLNSRVTTPTSLYKLLITNKIQLEP